jgi:hypothetical protein
MGRIWVRSQLSPLTLRLIFLLRELHIAHTNGGTAKSQYDPLSRLTAWPTRGEKGHDFSHRGKMGSHLHISQFAA